MSESKPARLGVIGLGNFGSLHADTIDRMDGCRLVAVVDLDENVLSSAKKRWPNASAFDKIDAAMGAVSIDGWIIATTSRTHVPIARRILSSGGNVLIEKPLAESVADAESLADFVGPHSSNLMLGHIVLFGSEFQALARQAKQRSPIQFIDAVRHRPRTTLDAFPGESPFHLTMVHDLYCIQALMRRSEPTHFSSQVHRDSSGRLDLALAQLQWKDGSVASVTASFLAPPGMPADGFDRIEVFGEDWSARISPNPRPFELWDDSERRPMTLEIDEESATGMLAEQLRCFCRVLRGESEVPMGATFSDGLQIQRWLERLADA